MEGSGDPFAQVTVVGEAPGKTEDDQGEPFVGSAGKLIRGMLEAQGITDLYFTNAVKCRPPENRTPKKPEVVKCKTHLDISSKYVLLLGNIALESVLGVKGIKKYRGKPIEKDGAVYMPTYHPAFIIRDETQRIYLERDLESLKAIIDFGGIPYEREVDYEVIDTEPTFERFLRALRGAVSIDTETSGLYPWDEGAHLTTIGFGTHNKQWLLPVKAVAWRTPWNKHQLRGMYERIAEALDDCYVIGHNWKFDALWLRVHAGICIDADFDTMLAHYLLDENDRHGLDHLAMKYHGAAEWDVPLALKQGNAGKFEDHCLYLATDVYQTRRLRYTLGKMLAKEGEVKRVFEKIMMPCVAMFIDVEFHGCYINVSQMDDVEKYLLNLIAEAETALSKWAKVDWAPPKQKGLINWGSPQQLGRLLFEDMGIDPIEKTDGGVNSTSESVLKRIDHPLVADLLKFRGAKQQLSFFIKGWKPYLVKNRLHPSFKLHGTVTGRPSCEHPNFQQIPRDPKIRSLICAPPGWSLVEADLSQIELRVAGELSGDRNLTYAFHHGVDIHWLTALREIARGGGMAREVIDTASTAVRRKVSYSEGIETLLKIGPDAACEIDSGWKELRKKAKAINFGYLYGMWWKKFKDYARDNYGVIVDDKGAMASREAFFELYSGLPNWHTRQRRFARRNGYVRSLSGRKRRLPEAMSPVDTPARREAERQSINSPVQSFASDLNLMAALQIHREFPRNIVHIVATVHDAIVFEVRDDWVERVSRRILEVMRGPELMKVLEIDISIPIEADLKIGSWSKGVSLEKWVATR